MASSIRDFSRQGPRWQKHYTSLKDVPSVLAKGVLSGKLAGRVGVRMHQDFFTSPMQIIYGRRWVSQFDSDKRRFKNPFLNAADYVLAPLGLSPPDSLRVSVGDWLAEKHAPRGAVELLLRHAYSNKVIYPRLKPLGAKDESLAFGRRSPANIVALRVNAPAASGLARTLVEMVEKSGRRLPVFDEKGDRIIAFQTPKMILRKSRIPGARPKIIIRRRT